MASFHQLWPYDSLPGAPGSFTRALFCNLRQYGRMTSTGEIVISLNGLNALKSLDGVRIGSHWKKRSFQCILNQFLVRTNEYSLEALQLVLVDILQVPMPDSQLQDIKETARAISDQCAQAVVMDIESQTSSATGVADDVGAAVALQVVQHDVVADDVCVRSAPANRL